jgi:hypothetical protein
LISSTPHPSKVFTMMIMTFDKTPNWWRIVEKISLQNWSQAEFLEMTNVVPIQGTSYQLVEDV